ncbi:hypothetical protein BS47DRAFT_902152 [Hydnum rufescens UP504]|uniref:Uncharacterized protein n=1 Tax=Hydnum rufescens UP504 TaxID=1448309 RepID=A0A9P6AXX2_9AGAM|nr:hypothetical protein BS47DRAFT_902152 [Hydnum rufescens UP504]
MVQIRKTYIIPTAVQQEEPVGVLVMTGFPACLSKHTHHGNARLASQSSLVSWNSCPSTMKTVACRSNSAWPPGNSCPPP